MYKDTDIIRVWLDVSRYGAAHCKATVAGKPLRHRLHHSPTGFSYGYAGSGPADLALSILDEVLPEEKGTASIWNGRRVKETAWLLYHPFKWQFVEKWDRKAPVEITVGEVRNWAAQYMAKTREGLEKPNGEA